MENSAAQLLKEQLQISGHARSLHVQRLQSLINQLARSGHERFVLKRLSNNRVVVVPEENPHGCIYEAWFVRIADLSEEEVLQEVEPYVNQAVINQRMIDSLPFHMHDVPREFLDQAITSTPFSGGFVVGSEGSSDDILPFLQESS